MLDKDNVLRIVQKQGPVVPNQIKKILGGDTLIIGAILSELVDSQQAHVSRTRFGSSPAYYVTGQERKLEQLTKYLNPEEQKTLKTIKEKKVLQDEKQPLERRLALRNLLDFAIPFQRNGKIYWRWHGVKEGKVAKHLQKPRRTKPKRVIKKKMVRRRTSLKRKQAKRKRHRAKKR